MLLRFADILFLSISLGLLSYNEFPYWISCLQWFYVNPAFTWTCPSMCASSMWSIATLLPQRGRILRSYAPTSTCPTLLPSLALHLFGLPRRILDAPYSWSMQFFYTVTLFATTYLSWFGDRSNCALETQNPVEISCKSSIALTPGVAKIPIDAEGPSTGRARDLWCSWSVDL